MSNTKKDKFGPSNISVRERRKTPCTYSDELIARAAKELHMDKAIVSKCSYAFLRALRDELLHYEKEISIMDFGIIKIVPRKYFQMKNLVDLEKRPEFATMEFYPEIRMKLRPKYTRILTKNVRFDEDRQLIKPEGDDIAAEPETERDED